MIEEIITIELDRETESIDFYTEENEEEIELSMEEEGVGEYPVYKGAYEVAPSFEKQTLETAYRVMTGNVEVESIPMETVSNTAGGMTLIIGG